MAGICIGLLGHHGLLLVYIFNKFSPKKGDTRWFLINRLLEIN